uniref:Uncharacterized protein n=1 Tax=Anguilla anguilla TaxID=7936 RepID=A0A0E9QYK7_ANGAN
MMSESSWSTTGLQRKSKSNQTNFIVWRFVH